MRSSASVPPPRKPPRSRGTARPSGLGALVVVGAAIAMVALLAGASLAARRVLGLSEGSICPGLRIAGERLPEGVDLDRYLSERARSLGVERVPVEVVDFGGANEERTFDELGLRLDLESLAK